MLQEIDLIPYSTADLPPGPWLVFAPHPDDETFGMGGSLLLASDHHIKTQVVVLTDGALGGAGGDELIILRKQEAKAAAECLGVENLTFWDLPDRGLTISVGNIQKVTNVLTAFKPASIFFPSPMEIHPDHRITAYLVWEGARRCNSFSGQVIAYEVGVQAQINTLLDISSVSERKREAMALYASQLKENNYIDVVQGLDRARTYTLPKNVSAAEGFYHYAKSIGNTDLNDYTREILRPYWCT